MNIARLPVVFLLLAALVVTISPASVSAEVEEILQRADLLLRLEVEEKGADLSFEEADRLLEAAERGIEETELAPAVRERLTRELNAVREDLEILTELYGERFHGVGVIGVSFTF